MSKSPSTVNASARKIHTGLDTDVLLVDLAKCGMDLHALISCALQDLSGTVQNATVETNALKTIISTESIACLLQLTVLLEPYGKMEIVSLLETTAKMDSTSRMDDAFLFQVYVLLALTGMDLHVLRQ
jgi:hypothetical protein